MRGEVSRGESRGKSRGERRRESWRFLAPNTTAAMFKDPSEGEIDGVGVGCLGGFEVWDNRYKWSED